MRERCKVTRPSYPCSPLTATAHFTVEAPTFLLTNACTTDLLTTALLEISTFTSEKMDPDGFKIGVLVSLHDAGLAWWTEDEILQERTSGSICYTCALFVKGGGIVNKYLPLILNEQNSS